MQFKNKFITEIVKITPSTDIERILISISDYYMAEFGQLKIENDFDDLTDIGVVYSTDGDGQYDIQISLDVKNLKKNVYIGGMLFETISFYNANEIIEYVDFLDFDEEVGKYDTNTVMQWYTENISKNNIEK